MTPTPTPTAAEAREALDRMSDLSAKADSANSSPTQAKAHWRLYDAYEKKVRAFVDAHPDAPPADEGVTAALDRMDALLDPACGLLSVPYDSATVTASRDDMRTIRAAAMPADEAAQVEAPPIPMVLYCPRCRAQHIDAPDERTPGWENPPHRSHLCHGCGFIWRPADVATVGVAAIQTRGKNDSSPEPASAEAVSDAAVEAAAREVRAFAFPTDDDQTRSILDVIAEVYGDEDIEHASETLDEMMYAALAAAHPAMVAETARLREDRAALSDAVDAWRRGSQIEANERKSWQVRAEKAEAENARLNVALTECARQHGTACQRQRAAEAENARLRAEAVPEGEPVAWQWRRKLTSGGHTRWHEFTSREEYLVWVNDPGNDPLEFRELFSAPPAMVPAAQLRAAERDALKARIEAAPVGELDVLRYERDAARAVKDHLMKTLVDIHMLLDPDDTTVNGKTYRFVNPMAAEVLHELSARIRKIPEAIKAADDEGKTIALLVVET